MNKFEKEVLKKLDIIIKNTKQRIIPESFSAVKKLEFEDHNFKVNSNGWKKITVDKKSYLENDTKDIWEILEGDCFGEQLFTWDAAMRETKKAGKRMPTDEEFSEILKTKDDISNIVYSGARSTTGGFSGRSSYAYLWSSLPSGGSAWNRYLNSGNATVYRITHNKAHGFSVRCLKN